MTAEKGRDRLLHLLKSRGPLSAAQAGEYEGISAQAAQQMFAGLASDGLVRAEDVKGEGRGRPRRLWRLTEAGHARFPDRHGDLSAEMIAAIRQVFGEEGLDALIQAREAAARETYRAALAEAPRLDDRLRALAAQRTAEGYMTHVERDGDAWLLIEDHCPICVAARHCQGFCRSELSLFREVLGAEVERVEHLFAGARRCAYRVKG